MLAMNPICKELYRYGYDGRQNILEYWTENKNDILAYLKRRNPEILNKSYFLDDFEAKVRWRSHVGIMLTLETYRILRKSQKDQKLDFKDVHVKVGPRKWGFDDFSHQWPLRGELKHGKTDLRGISILRYDIKNLSLENLDLRYASFDSTMFEHVRFINTNCDYTRFCRGGLKDCYFNEGSSLDEIDVSDTYIDAVFTKAFENPIFTSLKRKDAAGIFAGMNAKWRSYSEISSSSFYSFCEPRSTAHDIEKSYQYIERAYDLRGIRLFSQLLFIVKLPFLKESKSLRAQMNSEKHGRANELYKIPEGW